MATIQDDPHVFVRIALTFAAIVGTLVLAMIPPVDAFWVSGQASDNTDLSYRAVVNDSGGGERIELNCIPSGQAFRALSWNAAVKQVPVDEALILRFVVDGSQSFAAPARFGSLDRGWGAAELDTPEILGPLSEALVTGSDSLAVEAVQRGAVLTRALFDMDAASGNIVRYRNYCRL